MSHSTISLGLGLGGGKSATSSGAPGGTPYENVKSVSFDGVDDYATFSPGFIAYTADYTFSLWLKVDAFPSASQVDFALSNTLGSTLTLNQDNDVIFESRTGSNFPYGVKEVITNATEGQWYHLAIVKQADTPSGQTTFEYYVDGSSVGTNVRTANATYAFGNSSGDDQTVRLGRWTASSHYGNVKLDEISIFTSAFDATAVSGLWNNGSPADLESLSPRNWYRMGDGNEAGLGATVYDMGSASGTTTDMTLVNAPYSSDVP